MNHIPTPETNSLRENSADVVQCSDLLKFSKSQTLLCENLERRLTIARKALESVANEPLSQASIEKLAEETLELTKPKL